MKHDISKIKKDLYSAVISDVLDIMGYHNQAFDSGLHPLFDDTVIAGKAFTSIGTEVYSAPEHPLIAQCKVVDQLKEGEVFLLQTRGNYNCALFGELFATNVTRRGTAGVILDGDARDIKELQKMHFPIFFRERNPRTSKGRCEINECQIPIKMRGVTINPGDFIFADADGVVVIPEKLIDEVLDEAYKVVEKENDSREKIKNGATMEEIYSNGGAL